MNSYLSSYIPTPISRHLACTKVLPYPSSVVFNAVSDIGSYHLFLDLIISSTVITHDPQKLPAVATIKGGYPDLGLEEQWRCRVKCNRSAGTVEARSEAEGSGGFVESWTMKWKITTSPASTSTAATKKTTTVTLEMDIKIKYTIADQVLAQIQGTVAEKIVARFEARIAELEEARQKAAAAAAAAQRASKPQTTKPAAAEVQKKSKPPAKLEVRSGKQPQAQT